MIAAFPILLASFLGSAHCAGMCGGFVALYATHSNGRVLPHLLYNFGRLTTYLILGAGAALLGGRLDAAVPIARVSALIVGFGLIAVGVAGLFGRPSEPSRLHQRTVHLLQAIFKPVLSTPHAIRPFLIGLTTTLLPCGWLYGFVALALSSANIVNASIIMFAFWLGTLPALAAVALLSQTVLSRVRARMPRFTAILLIMSGFLSLAFHFAHAGHGAHHHHEGQLAAPEGSEHSHH